MADEPAPIDSDQALDGEILDEKQKSETAVVKVSTYSGPLPPPNVLARYDQVVPGAAERILQMAERNQSHQIAIESGALEASKRDTRTGQILALIVTLMALILAAFVVSQGSPWVGGLIGVSAVGTLALAFLKGNSKD